MEQSSKNIFALGIWLILSFIPGVIGSLFSPDYWYVALNKPSWNPPGYVFGPVWTLLYILIGISFWLVWKEVKIKQNPFLYFLILINLILNAIWSFLFFGLHRIDFAFYEILILWAIILSLLISFLKYNKRAALIFLPYFLWVSFAVVLNYTIWQLN